MADGAAHMAAHADAHARSLAAHREEVAHAAARGCGHDHSGDDAGHDGHGHGHGGHHHHHDHHDDGHDDACAAVAVAPIVAAAASAAADVLRHARRPAGSLAAEFLRAEALYHHIADGAPFPECTAHDPVAHAADALASFIRCAEMVRAESVFSKGEELEDINTGDLQYLLIDFYTAQLRQRAVSDRLRHMRAAKRELEAFLYRTAGMLKILPPPDAKACGVPAILASSPFGDPYERGTGGAGSADRLESRVTASSTLARRAADDEEADDYSTRLAGHLARSSSSSSSSAAGGAAVGGSGATSGGRPGGAAGAAGGGGGVSAYARAAGIAGVDPAAARSQKIERFKRNTAAKKRLAELAVMNAKRVEAARGAAKPSRIATGGRGAASGDDADDAAADTVSDALERAQLDGIGAALGGPVEDDEERRERVTLAIQCACRQAVDDVLAINQEMPLLVHREAQAAAAAAAGTDGAAAAAPAAVSAALAALSATGGPGTEAHDPRVRHRPGASGPPVDDISTDPDRPGIAIYRIDPTLTVKRDIVKATLETDCYKPPTMTLEEWGAVVTGKTKARDDREAKQAAARVKSLDELAGAGREDDVDAVEAAQEKARRFDDWADGVPRGSGVTKRI